MQLTEFHLWFTLGHSLTTVNTLTLGRCCLFVFVFLIIRIHSFDCSSRANYTSRVEWRINQNQTKPTNKQTKTQLNKNESTSFNVFQLTDVLCNEYRESIAHHDHNDHLRMPIARIEHTHSQRNIAQLRQSVGLFVCFSFFCARGKKRESFFQCVFVLCLYMCCMLVCSACRNGMELNVVACKWSNTRRVLKLDAYTHRKTYWIF